MEDLVSIETAIYMIALCPIADETLRIVLGVDSKGWTTERKADLIHKILQSKAYIASNSNTVKD